MSDSQSAGLSCNVGFTGVLAIVFIVLKLTNVIAWSWLWILSPLWIGFLLWFVVVVIIMGLIAFFGNR